MAAALRASMDTCMPGRADAACAACAACACWVKRAPARTGGKAVEGVRAPLAEVPPRGLLPVRAAFRSSAFARRRASPRVLLSMSATPCCIMEASSDCKACDVECVVECVRELTSAGGEGGQRATRCNT